MNDLKELTFWDHLDELRKVIFHIIIAIIVFMVAAFISKNFVFNIILAPSRSDFILYRILCKLSDTLSFQGLCPESFHSALINTQLPSQFLVHMKVSMYVGILLAAPYIVYQLFRFISPALYENERKYSAKVISYSSILFILGVLLNYFLIFPLSFRFLSTYQVDENVVNMINISSYIDTLLLLSLMLGIMAEIPVISWLFAKLGLINQEFMKKYRRHAILIIMIVAAVITPTVDIFTLILVFLPIYLLYELSILVVKHSKEKEKSANRKKEEDWENPYDLS